MAWLKIILSISRTHLLARLRQTVIASLGVTFGIGAYIILMGFMTGLNGMLDGLVTNRTPHVHIFNEIKPSKQQPASLYKELENNMNVVHSIKPKNMPLKVRNAMPIMNHLKKDERVVGIPLRCKRKCFTLQVLLN